MSTKKSTFLWLDTALYVIVFLLVQAITFVVVGQFFPNVVNNPTALVVSTSASNILLVLLFMLLRWSPFSRDYIRSRPWAVLAWTSILAFGTIIPSMFIEELMGLELTEAEEQLFRNLMSTPWGYLAVGILAPLAEEMVFRGALLRTLLTLFERPTVLFQSMPRWLRVWLPIVLSALVFGSIHGNLAQGIHAMLIGVLLGWLYWRSGSIVPGLVFHWVNNSVAYACVRIWPGLTDVSLLDLCGGSYLRVLLYVGFSLMVFLPALYQLHLRMKKNYLRESIK